MIVLRDFGKNRMDDLTKSLQAAEVEFGEAYARYYGILTQVVEDVKAQKFKKSELVDLGYLCREIAHKADDLRKEARAKTEFIGRMICLLVTRECVGDENADLSVRGTLATGTCDLRYVPQLPKFGTPEYELLCAYLELDPALTKSGIMSFSFDRTAELLTRLAGEGKKTPEGILKTYPQYSTKFVKIRK
jgi:hypothetical protein